MTSVKEATWDPAAERSDNLSSWYGFPEINETRPIREQASTSTRDAGQRRKRRTPSPSANRQRSASEALIRAELVNRLATIEIHRLRQCLAEERRLRLHAEVQLAKFESEYQESTRSVDDVVVFGLPISSRPVTIHMEGRSRGKPLIMSDDFSD